MPSLRMIAALAVLAAATLNDRQGIGLFAHDMLRLPSGLARIAT
jgi:hypothetical protein